MKEQSDSGLTAPYHSHTQSQLAAARTSLPGIMCILTVAVNAHDDFPLIMLHNRDEYHSRTATPLIQRGDILAAFDELSGGTWMGVNVRTGAVAALTNVRSREKPPDGTPRRSRGELVMRALRGEAEATASTTRCYSNYNLLHGEVCAVCGMPSLRFSVSTPADWVPRTQATARWRAAAVVVLPMAMATPECHRGPVRDRQVERSQRRVDDGRGAFEPTAADGGKKRKRGGSSGGEATRGGRNARRRRRSARRGRRVRVGQGGVASRRVRTRPRGRRVAPAGRRGGRKEPCGCPGAADERARCPRGRWPTARRRRARRAGVRCRCATSGCCTARPS